MLKSVTLLHINYSTRYTFSRTTNWRRSIALFQAAAIQTQFDQLSDVEKDEQIQDMYYRMDPILRQIFIDALLDQNQL